MINSLKPVCVFILLDSLIEAQDKIEPNNIPVNIF